MEGSKGKGMWEMRERKTQVASGKVLVKLGFIEFY